jgi:Ca2+-binding EF-hand superfamily protein
MADLKPNEVDKVKEHFEIFDTVGEGKVDAVEMGPLLRSLDLRVTNAMIEKAGGTKKKGEKLITVEELLPIYSQMKKEKDMGTAADFLEGLKVYDKNENGTMMAAELSHVLLSLGEVLNDREVDEIMTCCSGPQDEDGFMKYETFVKNLLAGPFPEEEKK